MAWQYIYLTAIIVTGLAAWYDWRTGEIPNWLTLGALGIAIFGNAILGATKSGGAGVGRALVISIVGVIICSLIPFFLFRAGAMGGGDVKLLAALGGFFGPVTGVEAQMYAFIVGALYGPARLAYQGKLFATLGNTAKLVKNVFVPKKKRVEVPSEMMSELRFAPSVFVATLLTAALNWRN